jgi:stage II sporulation protein D
MLLVPVAAEAGIIKVLIIDDMFRNIPGKDEKIEPMGMMKGDLLVNGTHYPGNIAIWKGAGGLYLINELPLEEYIKSVVSAEVGADWDMEALKAQAVMSRTYALFQKIQNSKASYDITSSVLHQVYKGAQENARISYAVMNTEGEVLTYNGKLIEAFYHSTSGGLTEAPEEVFGKSYPYLKPVATTCETSPYWIWERRVPIEEIEKALTLSGIQDIHPSSYTSTKRIKTVDVVHNSGTLTVKAVELRKLLGWNRLPSTNFTVSRDNGTMVFDGKGYGHGVGLCQWSALEMARSGMNYKEILSYFYPGTLIEIYENR